MSAFIGQFSVERFQKFVAKATPFFCTKMYAI